MNSSSAAHTNPAPTTPHTHADVAPAGQAVDRGFPTIILTQLPPNFRGLYDVKNHTIWLDERMTPQQRRCTLAHELVHAERGDTALPDPALNALQERLVILRAAKRLIALNALMGVLSYASGWQVLCEDLAVDSETLKSRIDSLTPRERAALRKAGLHAQYEQVRAELSSVT